MIDEWRNKASQMGLQSAKQLAGKLGFVLDFDWEKPRTEEGYYRIKGCLDLSVARSLQFCKHCDILWMETPTPRLDTAQEFAQKIKAVYPDKFLSYNLSPSFNWDAGHLTDQDIRTFCSDIAKLGYCWQFITLAGFHMNSLVSQKFSKDFAERDMLAYVQRVQRKERKHGVDQLKHQK